jgi:hypothetical protein
MCVSDLPWCVWSSVGDVKLVCGVAGNMKLPVQQVDALMGGLEVASSSSVFTPAADDQ